MPRTSQLPLFVVSSAPVDKAVAKAAPPPDPAAAEVLKTLRGLDCDDLSPRQALELLAKLCSRLK
jgi:hypothetical protein